MVWGISKICGCRIRWFKRCQECNNCYRNRKYVLLGKLMSKYEVLNIKSVFLWTFGSRLRGAFWFYLFNDIWRRFTIRMATYCKREGVKWSPTFRVYETGSRGDRIHCHVIFTERFPHERALSEWRKLVPGGNVNFTSSYSNRPLIDSVMYCVKYLMKDNTRNYSVMGQLLSIQPDRRMRSDSDVCDFCFNLNPVHF